MNSLDRLTGFYWVARTGDFARKKGFVINEAEYPLPDMPADDTVRTGGSLLAWQKPG